jgi:hypothetical protein
MVRIATVCGRTVDVHVKALKGRQVVVQRQLRNGHGTIPAGTVCTVASSGAGGLGLDPPACNACGVGLYITRVDRRDVRLVDTPKDRPAVRTPPRRAV